MAPEVLEGIRYDTGFVFYSLHAMLFDEGLTFYWVKELCH